jgi:3-oxoacyl-[acyl-carrier protein] reductase
MTVASTGLAPTALYPDLDGKVAVVTGGSRGIGTATAVALEANGESIAVVGRDQSAIDNTVGAVTAQRVKAIGVVADCTMEDQLAALRGTVNEQLGAVDILAVFAGGNGMPVPTQR